MADERQTTLVGRLRQAAEANKNEEWTALSKLLGDAADEIQRLQKALRDCERHGGGSRNV